MTNDTRIRYTFRLPQDLQDKLKEESTTMGISLNALLLSVLWQYIEQKGDK